jgi:hypothetical protein
VADPILSYTANGLIDRSYYITGLNPSSSYYFDINAVNCPGYSPTASTNTITFGPVGLFLPNMVLYGEPETFHDEYMMNETKRMFSVVFPQEQDIIEIIFKNKKPLVLGGVSN